MESIITPLFCEIDLLILVHLCVNVSAKIGYSGNFLTFLHPLIYCDFYILWYVIYLKSHIEIKNIFSVSYHSLPFFNKWHRWTVVKKFYFGKWNTFWMIPNKIPRLMLPIYICLLKVANIEQMSAHRVGSISNLITIFW